MKQLYARFIFWIGPRDLRAAYARMLTANNIYHQTMTRENARAFVASVDEFWRVAGKYGVAK